MSWQMRQRGRSAGATCNLIAAISCKDLASSSEEARARRKRALTTSRDTTCTGLCHFSLTALFVSPEVPDVCTFFDHLEGDGLLEASSFPPGVERTVIFPTEETSEAHGPSSARLRDDFQHSFFLSCLSPSSWSFMVMPTAWHLRATGCTRVRHAGRASPSASNPGLRHLVNQSEGAVKAVWYLAPAFRFRLGLASLTVKKQHKSSMQSLHKVYRVNMQQLTGRGLGQLMLMHRQ